MKAEIWIKDGTMKTIEGTEKHVIGEMSKLEDNSVVRLNIVLDGVDEDNCHVMVFRKNTSPKA